MARSTVIIIIIIMQTFQINEIKRVSRKYKFFVTASVKTCYPLQYFSTVNKSHL